MIKKIILFFTLLIHSVLFADHYQLVDIGLMQYQMSDITGINQKGQVCGLVKTQNATKVFIWDPEQKLKTYTAAVDTKVVINNLGQIAGSVWTKKKGSFQKEQHVFLWENPYSSENTFVDLGMPENIQPFGYIEKRAVVWDMNDKGEILLMNTIKTSDPDTLLRKDRAQLWIYSQGEYIQITHPQLNFGTKYSRIRSF